MEGRGLEGDDFVGDDRRAAGIGRGRLYGAEGAVRGRSWVL